MSVVLAIPARGGSKRLPGKNVRSLGGLPMIAYTIEAARRCKLSVSASADVYVCTESAHIAEVAESFGAKVFRVPDDMTGDLVSSTVPCIHLCHSLAAQGRPVETLINLQPSSPLRTAADISGAYATFTSSGADYLVSVTDIDPHYFHWAVIQKSQGWQMYFGDQFLMERPLLPKVQRPNGAIKIARFDRVKDTGNFFGDKLEVYPMPEERSIHVATEFDMRCAEAMVATLAR